jgi:hypothetical protein
MQPVIGPPVHALRFGREGVGITRAPPEPLLNLVRSAHRLVASILPLARIGQPVTAPAAKGPPTEIELGDSSPTGHGGAEKPEPSAAIRAWGRGQPDKVPSKLPVVVIGQIQAILSSGEIQISVAEEADVGIEPPSSRPILDIDGLARFDRELPDRATRSIPVS